MGAPAEYIEVEYVTLVSTSDTVISTIDGVANIRSVSGFDASNSVTLNSYLHSLESINATSVTSSNYYLVLDNLAFCNADPCTMCQQCLDNSYYNNSYVSTGAGTESFSVVLPVQP